MTPPLSESNDPGGDASVRLVDLTRKCWPIDEMSKIGHEISWIYSYFWFSKFWYSLENLKVLVVPDSLAGFEVVNFMILTGALLSSLPMIKEFTIFLASFE